MRSKNNGRILLNVTFLKNLRTKRGLTQDTLANDCRINRLAVSISSIKRAESGKKVLYRTALSLARYYEVDITDIICDSEVRPAPTASPSQRRPASSQCASIGRTSLTLINGAFNESQKPTVSSDANRCLIVLLVEPKTTVEKELQNYLRHLNIPFVFDLPHITLPIAQEDCDIEIFRYFKHVTQLLLTKFKQRIRLCAHVVYTPHLKDQKSSAIDRVQALPDSAIQSMRQILKLTAWESVSACSRIASSGACIPLSPVNVLSSAEKEWRYISATQPYIQFVGRHWELSQLCSCYQSVTQSREGITVYLDGMEGIGKSALVHRFIESINVESSRVVLLDLCHLSVARQPALQYLTRQLLGLPAQASDALVRSKIASSALSVTLQVFICLIVGVALRNTEARLLDAMGNEHRQAAISKALTELIDLRTAKDPLMLIIEDLYLADADFTEVIKLFTRLAQSRPLLLCITTRKSGKYSHRPAWLEHACTIELTGLTQSQSITLVNTLTSTSNSDGPECVRRAFGHPGYLLQIFHTNGCLHDFKASLYIATAFKLSQLNTTDVMALKIAAVYEHPFSLEQWRGIAIPLLGNPNTIHTPQTLVYAGLLKQCSDAYAFQHPVIRDVIVEMITREEQRQIEKAIQQWKIKWNMANDSVILSPVHTDDFNTLKNKAIENATFFQYKRAFEFYQAATRIAPQEARANLFNRSANCLLSLGKIADCVTFHQYALDTEPHNSDTEGHRIDLAKVYDLMGKHEKVMAITEHISEVIPRPDIDPRWDTWTEMHAVRGSCRIYSGCVKEARVDYQQAIYCSKQTSNLKIKTLALAGLAKCCYAQGRMRDAFENYNQCLKLCKGSGLLSMEAESRAMLTRVHLFQLETAKAIESGQQAVMLAHHTGNVRAELIARLSLSWVLLEVNAYPQARNEIIEGLKLAYKVRAFRYIAFLLESKARLLWLTGAGHKATIAISHALGIVKKQSLEQFTGSWFSATKAMVSRHGEESYQALAQGEEWLQASAIAQNVLNFYSQGISVAWKLKDTGLLKKYYSRLKDYNTNTPTQWADITLSRADLMLNLMNGSANTNALQQFNSRAAACNMFRLQFDLPIL